MTRDIVCCLTPAGASALAVVGLQGPTVWQKLSPYFRAKRQQPMLQDRPLMTWGTLAFEEMGDEIVLVLEGDESSQRIELQLHGGPGVVEWCLQFAQKLGCTRIDWTEWEQQELWRLLAQTTTIRTASILLDQCQGTFRRALEQAAGDPKQLAELLSWQALASHLVKPWKILLLGRPNAGKSSLLNAIVGYERAIISATPGTTRDLVSATIAWNGIPFEFIDSAGLRPSSDALESAGMALSKQSYAEADLVLWLADLSEPALPWPTDIVPHFVIGTKADLPHVGQTPVDFAV